MEAIGTSFPPDCADYGPSAGTIGGRKPTNFARSYDAEGDRFSKEGTTKSSMKENEPVEFEESTQNRTDALNQRISKLYTAMNVPEPREIPQSPLKIVKAQEIP